MHHRVSLPQRSAAKPCWRKLLARAFLAAGLLAGAPAQANSEAQPALTLSEQIKADKNARAPIDPRLADPNNLALKLSLNLQQTPALFDFSGDKPWRGTLRLLLLLFLLPLLWQALSDFARIFRSLLRSRPPQTPYLQHADWPCVSILLCGQPAGSALSQQISQLLATDYPRQLLHFFPVFDPRHTLTRSSIERHLVLNPKNVHPVHLSEDAPSTWAALKAAQNSLRGEVVILLDGKVPEHSNWLKQCISPFFDPGVGAVQSTPQHGPHTRLADKIETLGRAAHSLRQDFGNHWHLLPGALLAGLRVSALRSRSLLLDASPAADAVMSDALAHHGWRSAWVHSSVRRALPQAPWQQDAAKRAARRAYLLEVSPQAAPRYCRLHVLSASSASWLAALSCALGLLWLGDTLWAAYGLGATMACAFSLGSSTAGAGSTAASLRLHGNHPSLRLLPVLALSRLNDLAWAPRSALSQLIWGGRRLAQGLTRRQRA